MSNADPERSGIALRLRAAREQSGLSQGQIAKLLVLHRPAISEIEARTSQSLIRRALAFL